MSAVSEDPWATIGRLERWLAECSPVPEETKLILQILKISEEAGEVAEAVIGAMGQNPRKGYSHSWDDVQKELCDVIITSMVALTRLNPQAGEVFSAHLERVAERALGPEAAPEAAPAAAPEA